MLYARVGGQEAAPIGSGGAMRWSRVTVSSADASETCRAASYGRRHAHIAHLLNSKKNACNGRLNGRLGVRNYDIAGLKSSSILPVRSLEAWGAQRSELRTCRNDRNSRYQVAEPVTQAYRLRPLHRLPRGGNPRRARNGPEKTVQSAHLMFGADR